MVGTKTAVLLAVAALSIGSTGAVQSGQQQAPARREPIVSPYPGYRSRPGGPVFRREPKGFRAPSGKTVGRVIDGAGVAVDAVNAGVNIANAVKGKREPKGFHVPSGKTVGRIISGAGVAVDAVNAGVNIANAAKGKREPIVSPYPGYRHKLGGPVFRRTPRGRITGKQVGRIIDGAGVAVDAVNAGVNIANAAKGKREPIVSPYPGYRSRLGGPVFRREPKGFRAPSGKTVGRVIDGAGVAVDAVNAGVNIANAVKGKREPKGFHVPSGKTVGRVISGAGVAVDAVNAGVNIANAAKGRRANVPISMTTRPLLGSFGGRNPARPVSKLARRSPRRLAGIPPVMNRIGRRRVSANPSLPPPRQYKGSLGGISPKALQAIAREWNELEELD